MTARRSTAPRHALVLADGDAPSRAALDAAWPGWAEGVDYVVAADGGARLAAILGLRIDVWTGDGDSLGAEGIEELRAAGVPMERAPTDKDESDTQLGLLVAMRAAVREITILGALGGPRIDHAIANIQLLAYPGTLGIPVTLLDPKSRIRLVQAPGNDGAVAYLDLSGRVGDFVSLIPLDDVSGVTTTGLRYELRDELLLVGPARGLSNVRDAVVADVRIRGGRLIVVEVPATLPG